VECYFQITAASTADILSLNFLRFLIVPLPLPVYVCACLYNAMIESRFICVSITRIAESEIEICLFEPVCLQCIVTCETMTLTEDHAFLVYYIPERNCH
jgi:hypothetical protein